MAYKKLEGLAADIAKRKIAMINRHQIEDWYEMLIFLAAAKPTMRVKELIALIDEREEQMGEEDEG